MRTAATFRVGTPQQKLDAFRQIGWQFLGIDVLPLIQGQPAKQANGQQFQDPRVDQLLANFQAERTATAQREQQQLESTVTRWMDETDANGEPKRPYLTDVIGEMSALIPEIKSRDTTLTHAQALEQAYERAIWAHPEIRTLLQQKAASELEAKRRTDNQDRVREAKRAASVNVTRRASTPSAGKPGSLEETIAATARELGLIT
jgi:hypothetical protein